MTAFFPLTGEPLALDLLNTDCAVGDLVAEPAGLADWLATQEGRLAHVPPVGAAEVTAVHAVREAARAALTAARSGAEPPAEAMRVLNSALAGAPAHQELAWTPEAGLTAATVRPEAAPGARRLAAELAEAVAELLLGGRVEELRDCEGAGCTLVFLPAHPRRRWCVASLCGNRARVARYYARHKPTP
ncbi:ABATE domain-containing protein [Streptomyces sp. AP-93]|uniref:CGNR zinc finger domain-containing protein n=1 Tax=Streptomyces sp. AP-93 TaxID=2929048 RepID=UPI001FAEB513|nr:CGNR zinc finger domain-containing protein [Streptomyces sp. AP-93]MCJ0871003.1 CGNR zinc finger domain-containing protein [Streptomyces sp. AP-93]